MLTKKTKTQIKAIMNRLGKGESFKVWLCPNKCYPNPSHPFNCAINVTLYKEGEWLPQFMEFRDFETLINNFAYYNCNNELGNRVHYYIEG